MTGLSEMKALSILTLVLLTACTQPADFSNPAEIMRKETQEGKTKYWLRSNQSDGYVTGEPIFYAPDKFANVGDVIMYHRGSLSVRKATWKCAGKTC